MIRKRAEILAELRRVDERLAAMSHWEKPRPSGDWQRVGHPAQRVVVRSLQKYRERLARRLAG